jgi:hypothetical protein
MSTQATERKPATLGHHALHGWRGRVADAVAPPVAKATPTREEDVRAAIGLGFVALSAWHLSRTFRAWITDRKSG